MKSHPSISKDRSGFYLTGAIVILCLVGIALAGCGCVVANRQVVSKSTIFGIEVTTEWPPSIRAGLIRNHYVANPTSTNQIYAAPLESRMTLTNGWWSPTASENVEAGGKPLPKFEL